ncbi:hypothetical protein [Thermococcus celericrescens]|uniref:hypothetical protein n=1 Tax=Thermococcus celericrescens TaxID=227598 RepID=UPI0012EDABEF|nr:hypothetical protein [Thermococcus celericrescens]
MSFPRKIPSLKDTSMRRIKSMERSSMKTGAMVATNSENNMEMPKFLTDKSLWKIYEARSTSAGRRTRTMKIGEGKYAHQQA